VVGEHTYEHDVVAILRESADHVHAILNEARGAVVVVPEGARLRASERPLTEDLPVI
jgi:hypothetical protein